MRRLVILFVLGFHYSPIWGSRHATNLLKDGARMSGDRAGSPGRVGIHGSMEFDGGNVTNVNATDTTDTKADQNDTFPQTTDTSAWMTDNTNITVDMNASTRPDTNVWITGDTNIQVDMNDSMHPGFVPVFFPMIWSGIIQAGWNIHSYNVSAECKVELRHYVMDLRRKEDWANNMYDATGKQGPGLLKGSVTWHGNYDQCRYVQHRMASHQSGYDVSRMIYAQYCSISFSSPSWLKQYIERQSLPFPVNLPYITVDVCIPSGCVETDITNIILAYDWELNENVSLTNVHCHEDLDICDDAAALFAICVLATIGCFVVFGTIITIIVKLTTPKGEVKQTTLIGYFSKRGSIFSVARQNSVLHHRSSMLSNRGSVYCKRANSVSRQESVKDTLNNNSPTSITPPPVELVGDVEKRGDNSPGIRMREHAFTEGEPNTPAVRKESLILQNGALEPINELIATSPVTMRPNSSSCKGVKVDESKPTTDGKKMIGGVITDLFLCFSFPNNVTAVLGEGNTNHLFCLSGIRFLSISWIVMGNTLSFIHKAPDAVENSVVGVELSQSLWFQAIINSTFAADTFFVLSGTLLSYNFMRGISKKMAAGKTFKVSPKFIFLFYLHRFIRIAPCYYVAVMIFTNLLPYMGHGPRWKYVSSSIDQCKDHWWANVFFFSNFYKADDMCMSWTYYLVNDFQFYLMSPLILIPLVKLPKLGFALLGALIATQIISVGILNNKINGNMLRMDNGYFSEVYAKPYCRVGVFAIGMVLGYILNKLGRRIYLRKFPLLIGWLVSICLMTLVVYVTYLENRVGGSQWTGVQTALYEALSRPAWGLAVAWVIFACSIGQGGYIHKFLSWNFFLPLCRITYGIYLLHPLVIVVVIDTSRNLLYLSPIDLWLTFVPILITATIVALVLITCVEGPFIRLEKLIRTITS